MKSDSPVIKRSIFIGGHKTSVSIEDDFWSALSRESGIQSNKRIEKKALRLEALIQPLRFRRLPSLFV